MEETFEWIEQGNHARDERNYWKASHCFSRAFQLLHSFPTSQTVTPEIKELCLTQSRDYKQKARDCFVQALVQEHPTKDTKDDGDDDKGDFERLELFAQLYSDPTLLGHQKHTTENTTTTLDDLSLRLQALHEFQVPKQSLSKMEELNAGLCRLGLSPVIHEQRKQSAVDVLGIEASQSPDEQVNALLQQVQEQVQVTSRSQDDAKNVIRTSREDDNVDDDDDDSMDEQMQVNRLLQQIQDEQALQGMIRSSNSSSTVDREEETENEQLSTRPQTTAIQSEPSMPLSSETAKQVMKDTLEAELLLTQVIGLLEDESSSLSDTADGTVVQTLLRQARSTLRRAEQHIAKK